MLAGRGCMDKKTTVILVRQEGLGFVSPDDRNFGYEMFDKFLHVLESLPSRPEAICFYTEGVKLAAEGSPLVPPLKLIEGMGVRLLICVTCVDYYGLRDRIAVGQICGMNDIVRLLLEADNVLAV